MAKGEKLRAWNLPNTCGLAFSADGKILATATSVKKGETPFVLWDVETGKALVQLDDKYPGSFKPAIALSADGKLVATGIAGPAKTIRIWNAQSGKLLGEIKDDIVDFSPMARPLAFSQDSKILAVGSSSGVRLWQSVDAKATLKQFPAQGGQTRPIFEGLHGIPNARGSELDFRVGSVAFSPNDTRIAVLCKIKNHVYQYSADLSLFDTTTGKRTHQFDIDSDTVGVHGLAFSPNGELLVVEVDHGNGVLVFDARAK
jgi:sugar lactone lactonase YvrE